MNQLSTVAGSSGIIDGMAERAHVKLSGDLIGRYVVEEARVDGRLVLAPEISAAEIRAEINARSLTDEEWETFLAEHGPELLPPDDEG